MRTVTLILATLYLLGCSANSEPVDSLVSLRSARDTHKSLYLYAQPPVIEPPAYPPPTIFKTVTYPSPAGDLAAYITQDPEDGKKHPAVVWAHGGFGGLGSWFWEAAPRENDQSARAFRERGIVLMCPSWRGENGNPGQLELFYGEVDDLLAAVDYVRRLPFVDHDRIYLAGHSTGGTLVLLAAVSGASFRAAFSFGGAPDIAEVVGDGKGYGNTPFDYRNPQESYVRSAAHFARYIQHPTFYFEGLPSAYARPARRMASAARRYDTPFQAYLLPDGDHFSILAPLTELIAEKILADTGPTCNISFSEKELTARLTG